MIRGVASYQPSGGQLNFCITLTGNTEEVIKNRNIYIQADLYPALLVLSLGVPLKTVNLLDNSENKILYKNIEGVGAIQCYAP